MTGKDRVGTRPENVSKDAGEKDRAFAVDWLTLKDDPELYPMWMRRRFRKVHGLGWDAHAERVRPLILKAEQLRKLWRDPTEQASITWIAIHELLSALDTLTNREGEK